MDDAPHVQQTAPDLRRPRLDSEAATGYLCGWMGTEWPTVGSLASASWTLADRGYVALCEGRAWESRRQHGQARHDLYRLRDARRDRRVGETGRSAHTPARFAVCRKRTT